MVVILNYISVGFGIATRGFIHYSVRGAELRAAECRGLGSHDIDDLLVFGVHACFFGDLPPVL